MICDAAVNEKTTIKATMRYVEFRNAVRNALSRSPAGLSWAQLKECLDLLYSR